MLGHLVSAVALYLAMPLTGEYAWKEENISPEERVDRFCNMIDHAVGNGIPLDDLFHRRHLKEFFAYTLQHLDEPCKSCTLRTTKGP